MVIDILLSEKEPPNSANEAKSLIKKLNRLETILMTITWNDILQQANIISKQIQIPGIDTYMHNC